MRDSIIFFWVSEIEEEVIIIKFALLFRFVPSNDVVINSL